MKTKEEIKRDLEFFVKNHGKKCFFDGNADVLSGYNSDIETCWSGKMYIAEKCELIPEPEDDILKYRETVEQANRDGKVIQWTQLDKEDWKYRIYYMQGAPLFWDMLNYRIKPSDGEPCGEKVEA